MQMHREHRTRSAFSVYGVFLICCIPKVIHCGLCLRNATFSEENLDFFSDMWYNGIEKTGAECFSAEIGRMDALTEPDLGKANVGK